MAARLARLVAGRRSKWILIGVWIALAAVLAPLQPKLQDKASNENEAFLSRSAESTVVNDLVDERFPVGEGVNAQIVYTNPAGLSQEDLTQIESDARSLCDSGVVPDIKGINTPYSAPCGEPSGSLAPETPPSPLSEDGTTALVSVDTYDEETAQVVEDVAALRDAVPDPDASGLRAYVTGEAAFIADASEAFEGIDTTLLAITIGLVLVLLLAIYRSPVVALVPLFAVGAAYVIAAGIVYALVDRGTLEVTGQTTAILIVLMFGAGTDYCLLLVSRYRDELRGTTDVHAAMARAVARSGPAIVSAGATVVAAMLLLALADYRATRTMGPVLALGIAVMVLAGVTLLPALLTALGRRAFWPSVPVAGGAPPRAALWHRIGALVRARPAVITAVVLAVLALGALGNVGGRGTLSFTENFRDEPGSVQGQQLTAEEFAPGRAAPLSLVADVGVATGVAGALEASPLVEDTTQVNQSADGKLMLIDVTPAVSPLSGEAADAVPELREIAQRQAGGREALIGGLSAETYDSRAAQRSDARLLVPLTLLLVLLIVAALVRAVVAPLYLVATVVLSYAFALGAASLVFTHLFGQPDSDPGLPLFAFIFLVALGVDYNIFLIARIREEHAPGRTDDAVIAGLVRTGGVISSAGLILAGTFASLMSLPVVGLVQVGFTIALGLLVDTFLIRIFLVPALALLLGERNWWPSRRPARRAAPVYPEAA